MIRPAHPQDVPAILAFWNPLIAETLVTFNPDPKTEAEVIASLQDKATRDEAFLVYEEAGEILGFVTYGQFRGGRGYGKTMEHTIILSERAHGRGVGRALMEAVEDHARARGHHSMVAAVSGGNPAGRAFHLAIGYCEIGTLPQAGYKFDRYWDLILLQKILS